MKPLVRGLGVVIGLALLTTPFVARALTARALAQADAYALTEAEAERFLADAARVAALGVFPEPGPGARDAGELLNKWVVLDGAPAGAQGPDEAAAWLTLEGNALNCPRGGARASAGAPPSASAPPEPPAWPACVTDVPTVDLSWMADLARYDVWNPTSSGPLARHLAAHPDQSLLTHPLPNYAAFLFAGKARLLQGRAHGDLPAARAETRALTRLLWSAEGLIPTMMAASLLNVDRGIYEDAVAAGIPAGDTPVVSKEDATAVKRYLMTLVLVYGGDAPPGTVERLAREIPNHPGRCGAVAEAMALAGPYRDFFDGDWPGEIDRSARLAALDAAATDGQCQLAHVGRAWRGETRALTLDALLEGEGPDPLYVHERVLAATPWVRQAYVAPLLGMGAANYNSYREP